MSRIANATTEPEEHEEIEITEEMVSAGVGALEDRMIVPEGMILSIERPYAVREVFLAMYKAAKQKKSL